MDLVLASDCTGNSSNLLAAQCVAFGEFYDSTGGAQWTACGATKTDPCSCSTNFNNQYIRCDKGSIIDINLGGVGVTGTIPASFGAMTDLKLLWLMSNQLTAPPSFETQTQLEDLDLSWNNMSGSIPSVWSELSQLTALDVYSNALTGTIPQSIGNLSQLKHLCFGKNHLLGTIPTSMSELTNLETLNLEENQFSADECEAARHLIPDQCSIAC